MQITIYYRDTNNLVDEQLFPNEIIKKVSNLYNNPPEGCEKIMPNEMHQFVCFNMVRNLYEEILNMPHAGLIIYDFISSSNLSALNKSITKELQDEEIIKNKSYYKIYSNRNNALVLALLWHLCRIHEDVNKELLSCIRKYLPTNEESIKIFDYINDKYMNIDSNRKIYVSSGNKTDIIKIFNYLYEFNVFVDEHGEKFKTKQEFMESIGDLFNSNFVNYSQTISSAKNTESYLNIFNQLLDSAKKDYLSDNKNNRTKK